MTKRGRKSIPVNTDFVLSAAKCAQGLGAIADDMGVSRRTLQRKLKAAGRMDDVARVRAMRASMRRMGSLAGKIAEEGRVLEAQIMWFKLAGPK